MDSDGLPRAESIPTSSLDTFSIDSVDDEFRPDFDQVTYRRSADTVSSETTTDDRKANRSDENKKPKKHRRFFGFKRGER